MTIQNKLWLMTLVSLAALGGADFSILQYDKEKYSTINDSVNDGLNRTKLDKDN
jgi:hypothetical protein